MPRIVVDEKRCKGCERCVKACPMEAISLCLEPSIDVLGDLTELIAARTEIA